MLIGVLSDTHGRLQTVQLALEQFRRRGVELLIHCGDIDDADTVRLFRGFTAHFVFGNCDGDRDELRQVIGEVGGTIHEPFGDLELAGRRLAFVHGDHRGQLLDLERSEYFDYLFHGHTHHAEERLSGKTRVINPGALFRAARKTVVVLDLAAAQLEWITVA